MNAIDKLLNTVEWHPVEYVDGEPRENLPHVTHVGVLKILDVEMKVCQLSNGLRIFEEGELEKLFRIAPQENKDEKQASA